MFVFHTSYLIHLNDVVHACAYSTVCIYICLNLEIEFPFKQQWVSCECNIECLLCPRHEKIDADTNRKKDVYKISSLNNSNEVINIHSSIIVKMTRILYDLQSLYKNIILHFKRTTDDLLLFFSLSFKHDKCVCIEQKYICIHSRVNIREKKKRRRMLLCFVRGTRE